MIFSMTLCGAPTHGPAPTNARADAEHRAREASSIIIECQSAITTVVREKGLPD